MVEWVDSLLGDAREPIEEDRSGLVVLDCRKRDHCGPRRGAEGSAAAFQGMGPGRRLSVS